MKTLKEFGSGLSMIV